MSPHELFLSMARLLPEPMLLLSASGEILAANRPAAGLFGCDDGGELVRRNLSDFLTQEDQARPYLKACLGGGQLLPGALTLRRSDGGVMELRAEGSRFQPLRSESPAVVLRLQPKTAAVAPFAVLNRQIERLNTEIRERRRAEREVLELNAALESKVRARTADLEAANAELDAFAGAVSHDLRASLRAIASASHFLAEDARERLTDMDLALLKRQYEAAIRMGKLVDSLLQMARYSRAEVRKCELDLTRVAEEAVQAVAADYATCGTTFEIQSGMWAKADPDLLRFVYENLVSNACKFSCHAPEPRVEIGRAEHIADAPFFVRDNGVGFNPAYAERLFLPFERLHSEAEFAGSGVGLANVQRIISRHGGRVWADGAVGKGATVFFTLA